MLLSASLCGVCRVELYSEHGFEVFLMANAIYYIHYNRSHKEKRSSYAPEKGLRYDGVYRIEKCWRKVGIQVLTSLLITILGFGFLI